METFLKTLTIEFGPQHLLRRSALVSALAVLAIGAAEAQSPSHVLTSAPDFPNKVVTLVVPYAAGGTSDIRARQLAQKLSTYWGKPVIVDNKPGGAGNIGTEFIARAKPDGHVIGIGNFAPLSVNQHLYPRMGFDPLSDLSPVALLEKGPLVLMVRAGSPYASLKDLIKAGRNPQSQISYASGGPGGSHHLSAELLLQKTGMKATHVPYRGGAPATNDLIAGTVDFMLEWIVLVTPYTRSAQPKLRALAISSLQRSPLLPDVPTFAESGVSGMDISNWFGIVAPKGTPRPIIDKLNADINRAVQEPDLRERIQSLGNQVAGGSPEAFASLIRTESTRWGELIRTHHIRAD